MTGAVRLCTHCHGWGVPWIAPSDGVARCPTCGTPTTPSTAPVLTMPQFAAIVHAAVSSSKSIEQALAAMHGFAGTFLHAPLLEDAVAWVAYPCGGMIRVDLERREAGAVTMIVRVRRPVPDRVTVTVVEDPTHTPTEHLQ